MTDPIPTQAEPVSPFGTPTPLPPRREDRAAAESQAAETASVEDEVADAEGALDPAGEAAPAAAFAALGLQAELVRALAGLGYEEPTPIQKESIPALLAGRDLLGQAATGTGKTAAFALPMLQRVLAEGRARRNAPKALVLVPTRELAMQVAEAVHKYGKELEHRVLPIYGGQSIVQQLRALDRGVDIVVATPGRALDHLERGTLELSDVKLVVLDEADEMLDMGFAEDLEAILGRLPERHQTALFSATLAPRILAIAEQHLENPVRISIARERAAPGALPRVRQVAYVVPRAVKPAALARVLDAESPASTIVFCRTRVEVDELTEAMNAHGWRAEALHGGFSQDHRDRVMKRFRGGTTDLLVATDVAARGLDIDHVTHVVNYDVPTEPDAYVHRIGRTGRAGRDGVAITLLEPREQRLLKLFQRATQQPIPIEPMPTQDDVRTRRMEELKKRIRGAVLEGGLDAFRSIAKELSSELDPLDVAAAAAKLVHQAEHATEDEDAGLDVLLQPQPRRDERGNDRRFEGRGRFDGERAGPGRFDARGGFDGGGRGPRREFHDRGPGGRPPFERGPDNRPPRERGPMEREAFELGGGRERGPDAGRDFRGGGFDRRGGDERGGFRRGRDSGRGPEAHGFDKARLFLAAGRIDNIRPGDLVGAIANEAGIPGEAIGAIEIQDRFSIVEVPEDFADDIIQALRNTKIRGRKVNVRRDQFGR
ncbi:MAG: DEAD/DEAH box helicase [Planctomycetota bacterium]